MLDNHGDALRHPHYFRHFAKQTPHRAYRGSAVLKFLIRRTPSLVIPLPGFVGTTSLIPHMQDTQVMSDISDIPRAICVSVSM